MKQKLITLKDNKIYSLIISTSEKIRESQDKLKYQNQK